MVLIQMIMRLDENVGAIILEGNHNSLTRMKSPDTNYISGDDIPFIMAVMTMTMIMILRKVMISEDRHELAALWLECKELSILF